METAQESTSEVENALGGLPPPNNCGVPPEVTLDHFASPGPYGFATRDYVFVDPTRSTPPNNSYPGSPVRTLPTRVAYPTWSPGHTASPPPAEPVPIANAGRFPIVVNAHGLTALDESARCEHLATHGYICASPIFPLSNGNAPGGPTLADIGNQPEDLDFVMNEVAQLPEIGPAVDTKKRGLLGFSAGGFTVLLAAYHPAWQIPNIKAAVALAPLSCVLGAPVFSRPIPTLIISGTADMLVPIQGPEKAFTFAPPKVGLAKLIGGTHSGFMNFELPHLVNTDIVVCEALLASNPGQADPQIYAAITQGIGPAAFDPTGCSQLCSQVFPQTMGATRQIKLARAATLAHFEAILRGNPLAAAFLIAGLDALPDVDVSVKF